MSNLIFTGEIRGSRAGHEGEIGERLVEGSLGVGFGGLLVDLFEVLGGSILVGDVFRRRCHTFDLGRLNCEGVPSCARRRRSYSYHFILRDHVAADRNQYTRKKHYKAE